MKSEQDNSAISFDNLGQSIGGTLRRKLFPQVFNVLGESDRIADSNVRLPIQSNCLDLITGIEDTIARFGLDQV